MVIYMSKYVFSAVIMNAAQFVFIVLELIQFFSVLIIFAVVSIIIAYIIGVVKMRG